MLNFCLSKLQKWFFVAGTSIMSSTGAMAVEQIRPGMMVWCAPEDGTGQGCYRPVLETYQNRADAIYHIRYDHDGLAATPEQTLSASAEHPVWVEESGAFVPVAELTSGMTLRMANGRGGRIAAVTAENTAPRGGTPVFNFAVAEHHTYYAGNGGVWVHNSCQHLDEFTLGKHEGFLADGRKLGHAEDIAHDMALDKALQVLRSGKHDAKILTQTGAELFENTPSIIRGAAADDIVQARRFLDDTGLGEVPNQPASLVRAGDGGQPFFATPMKRMPDDWAELAGKMQSELGLAPDSKAWIAAEHCEALGLRRAVDKLGPGVTEFDISTAGRAVCGHCVGDGGASGLAEIAMKMGVTKLRIRSALKFQTKAFENETAVTIIINQATKSWQIIKGIE